MDKNLGTLNPLNEDKFFEEFDTLEEDARKEKIRSVLKERNDIMDSNRKLFMRAKEAEGFKQDEEGNWIKTVEKPKAKDSVKSDEEVTKRLDKMALKLADISAADEVELYDKWKDRTKMEAEEIIEDEVFQAQLGNLRTAKVNAAATADVKGEGAASGAKNDPDYWIAKATKNDKGELMFPEELPNDFKLRAAIIERMGASTKSTKQFYNS